MMKRLKKLRNRKTINFSLPSMSDISFLLIIFFIINISFIYKQGIKLTVPKKGAPPIVVPLKEIIILTLDKSGNLFLEGKKIKIEDLRLYSAKKAAVIKINKFCKYRNLVSVIEELKKNKIDRISLKQI